MQTKNNGFKKKKDLEHEYFATIKRLSGTTRLCDTTSETTIDIEYAVPLINDRKRHRRIVYDDVRWIFYYRRRYDYCCVYHYYDYSNIIRVFIIKKNKNNTRSVNRVLANNGRCTYSFLSVFPTADGDYSKCIFCRVSYHRRCRTYARTIIILLLQYAKRADVLSNFNVDRKRITANS